MTTGLRTTGSGSAPASSGIASSTIVDASLASDLSRSPAALGIDGSTMLTAATGLYQQAKILDNQISKAIRPRGYRAHLLTFQVNLQPVRRDLPYDTYLNVSLAPGTWEEALGTSPNNGSANGAVSSMLPVVIVHPLVITDALEASSVGRSVELIKQAALSIAGVVGTVGVNAGVSGGTDSLDSTVNLDKNSLVTLGRVNDSTLRIRLGAANGGVRKFSMVSRTYNVSVVVLTRDGSGVNQSIGSLSVVARSTLVDAVTGRELDGGGGRARARLIPKVNDLVTEYWGSGIVATCGPTPYPNHCPHFQRRYRPSARPPARLGQWRLQRS